MEQVRVWQRARLTPLEQGAPRELGSYRLIGRLGQGGMGSVYLGVDRAGTAVAVKVLRPELATDEASRARFRRELLLAERVRASCTAQVIAGDVDADPAWIATEYVAGPTLAEHVATSGPLDQHSLQAFAAGMAEALMAIHAAGVIHRDLTARNVLLAVEGPKVVDFGIARVATSTALTLTGGVIGTPGWLAPEVIRGGEATEAADVFAWGCLVVLAASGRGPYGEGRPEQVMYRVLHEGPRLPHLDEPLGGLVAAALDADPGARPTPAQMVAVLTAAGGGDPDDPGHAVTELLDRTWQMPVATEAVTTPSEPARAGRGVAILAVVVILLGIGAGLAALAFRDTDDVALDAAPPATGTPADPDPEDVPELTETAVPTGSPSPDPTPTASPSPDPTPAGSPSPDPTPTAAPPPDPQTVDLAGQFPDDRPEVVRTIADRADGVPTVLVVVGDVGRVHDFDSGEDLIMSGLLFEWDGDAYQHVDTADLYCEGAFEAPVVDGDGEIVYIDCIGSASANALWALHPDPGELVGHPFPDGEWWTGWDHSGWTTEPVSGGQDQLVIETNPCVPSCAEGLLETRWLDYDPSAGEWFVDSCRPVGERLYLDPRPSASRDPFLTGPC